MKFSNAWLKNWVTFDADVDALCDQLTSAGLEVDGVEPVAADFSGVVVARIVEVEPHPDADKLRVCRVDAGDEMLDIVCGAPNVRPGLKAPLAKVGAVLPEGFKIKKAKLRGVESNGMLCSAAELGIGTNADGLLELEEDLEAGTDIRAALELDDVTIELDLTPNRGDCLSIRGLAREVGLVHEAPLHVPSIDAVPAQSEAGFPVRIDAPDGCPRYLGRMIEGVDLSQSSPFWMQERLRRCGLRSIDPVVDVTNYVLLELGQPMHAFDRDQLSEGIVVRMAREGETLRLLDGRDVDLTTDTLLITDGNGPVAMAGVMGGERSGVSASTKNVFLECAFFNRLAIMGVARRYGMHTDAAHRYERGVDFELQHLAMERATQLLIDIVGGTPGPVEEAIHADALPAKASVELRRSRLDLLVGEVVPEAQVDRIFEALDFSPRKTGTGDALVWFVTAPSHRFDIEREEDLVEEVLRVYGYNTIESRTGDAVLELGAPARERTPQNRVSDAMVDLGYAEAITYSFIEPRLADRLDPGAKTVTVVNPVSNDHSAMRTTLLPGLVSALANNLARQATRVRLFETGQCFPTIDGELQQEPLLGGIAVGAQSPESWASNETPIDFYDIKGDVERILELGGMEATFERVHDPVLHPGQSASVLIGGEVVGRLGKLHPEVTSSLDLPDGVFFFELRLEAITRAVERRHLGVSRFPSVRRDLALVVDQSVDAGVIEELVRATLGDDLRDFVIFDVYTGKGIDSNEKSIAIALTLQDASRTLNDSEVNESIDSVVDALVQKLGARLR